MSRKLKYIQTESRLLVIWDWGLEWGLPANGHEGSFLGNKKV